MSRKPTVGTLIKSAREKKGMTQHELGAKLGMRSTESAQVQICRYESDVIRPPIARLVQLAGILKIPINHLTEAVVRDEKKRIRKATEKLHK